MAIILEEILNIPIHDVPSMKIPYICYGNGIIRLKRIIYLARCYLAKRSPAEIKQACADALYLYRWFFEFQAKKIQVAIIQQEKNNTLFGYLDLEQYIEDSILSLKLAYLSEVDVLNALLHEQKDIILNQIENVKSGFSHAEFFCVLALYHASIAMTKIHETKEIIADYQIADGRYLPATIEELYDAILEAKTAIDYAQQYSETGPAEFSNLIEEFTKESRRNASHKGHEVRYGEKYQQRRSHAIALYEKGGYRSRLEAALNLVPPIQTYSEQLGIPLLTPESAQETIYKWLSQYDKGLKA